MNINFERLCRLTGHYSLPFLVDISNGSKTIRFINDTQSMNYMGNNYLASTFEYIPNADIYGMSGGGILRITAADAGNPNGVIAVVQEGENFNIKVIGLLYEKGNVQKLKGFEHTFGTVNLDGRTAEFEFLKDDRLDMTFPALIFSHYNTRGST